MTLNAEVSVGGSISMAVLFAGTSTPVPGFAHAQAQVGRFERWRAIFGLLRLGPFIQEPCKTPAGSFS